MEPSYLPRTCIGMIGSTGLGKSTLLRKVLGREILHASSMERGTAAPTFIVYHPHERIEASLSFMPLEEVRVVLESTFDLLEADGDGDRDVLENDPSYKLVNEGFGLYRRDLKRIQRESANAQGTPRSPVDLILQAYPELVQILGTTVSISEENEDAFNARVKLDVGSAGGLRGLKKWVFLTSIVIKCNAEVLANGSILVDFPGEGDRSTAVRRAIERMQRYLDVKLIAVYPQRASSESIVKNHMAEEILRRKENPSEQVPGTDASEPLSEGPQADISLASSSSLAIVMMQCDMHARDLLESEIGSIEDDEDVAQILKKDTEYLRVYEESKRSQAEYQAQSELVARLRKEKNSERTNDAASLSKGTNQRSPRSGASKYPRLDSDNDEDDDEDDLDIREGDSEIVDAEREETRYRTIYARSLLKRQVPVLRARFLVSGIKLRREFGELVMRARAENSDELDNSDVQEDYEDLSLPVFATSAVDCEAARRNRKKLERSGVPALQKFIRHQGARIEYQAVLRLLRPFRAEVQSTYLLLTANDTETVGGKVARQKHDLKTRWFTSTSLTSADNRSQATDKAVAAGRSIRHSLEDAFEMSMKDEIKRARNELEVLQDTCMEGASEAADGAQRTAQVLVGGIPHWAQQRAIFKRLGVYADWDYNIDLGGPFYQAVERAMSAYCGFEILITLRARLIEAASRVFDDVRNSLPGDCNRTLRQQLWECISKARGHVKAALDEIKLEGNKIFWTSRHRSEADVLSDGVKDFLKYDYDKAEAFRGRGSLAASRECFVTAVANAANVMFDTIARDFVKYRTTILDEIEALIKKEYTNVAKECELEISNAWVVPAKDERKLRVRTRTAAAVKDIERQLLSLETELVQEMQRAEKDVPTCHPKCC